MKTSVFCLSLLVCFGFSSLSHALGINPKSVHAVVEDKIYRAGVTKANGFGNPITDFSYPCENGFTLVINAYSKNKPKTIQCPDGRNIVYAGAHWQNIATDDIGADELRRGGKVLVHCVYGVDASNLVAWIAAARAGLMTAKEASNGFYNGQKGSLGDTKYKEMSAAILKRGS